MKSVDDFQIITTPCVIDDFTEERKDKNQLKSKKSFLNKVSRISDTKKPIFNLKPKWVDDTEYKESAKYYKCLDIEKILATVDQSKTKIEKFGVISNEKHLLSGLLEFYRCCDGNRDYTGSKFISFSVLHPQKKCMITGSNDGTLCVFKIDGEHNDAVCKPIYIEKFPINGGNLLINGKSVVIFSRRSYYKVFDFTTSEMKNCTIEKSSNIRRLEVSPAGNHIIFSNEYSTIFVVSTFTFNVVQKLHVSDSIKSMAFSHNGKYLYVFEVTGKISVFEFKEKGCPIFQRKWFDDGCINAVKIAISPNNEFIACGSLGIVNIYQLNETWKSEYPKPIKTIHYPDSRVNQLLFNNSSELLAIGYSLTSDKMIGGFKLLNLSTKTIYQNFPASVGMARPTSFSFSPNDKYLAVGRFNGKVTLFALNYYEEY